MTERDVPSPASPARQRSPLPATRPIPTREETRGTADRGTGAGRVRTFVYEDELITSRIPVRSAGMVVPVPGQEFDERAAKLYIPFSGPAHLIPRLVPPPPEPLSRAETEALRASMFPGGAAASYEHMLAQARGVTARDQQSVMRKKAAPVVTDAFAQIAKRNAWAAREPPPSPKPEYVDRGLGLSAKEVETWKLNLSDPALDREARQSLLDLLSPTARAQIYPPASEAVVRTYQILGDEKHLANYRLLETFIGSAIVSPILQLAGALPLTAALANALAWYGRAMTAYSVGEVAINVAMGTGLSENDQLTLLMTIAPALFHTLVSGTVRQSGAPPRGRNPRIEMGPGITSSGKPQSIGATPPPPSRGSSGDAPHRENRAILDADVETLGALAKRADANARRGDFQLRTENGVTEVSTVVAHPSRRMKVRVTWDSTGKTRYTKAPHSDVSAPPIESINAEKYAFGGESRVVSSRTSPAAANQERAGILEGVDYNVQTAPRALGGEGKIGIQRPGRVNDGGPDSIVYNQYLDRIEVRDVKGRGPGGAFPRAPSRSEILKKWGAEISLAIDGVRGDPQSGFRTKYPKLDARVRKAWAEGRWDYVQPHERLPAQVKAGPSEW